jgi:hypothetical protein
MTYVQRVLLLVLVLVAVALVGCGDATEVLVVTDSDLSIPAEIDTLETVVVSPGGVMQRSTADLSAQGFPRTLSLVHEGDGALGPYDVSVSGRLGGSVIVSRQAAFTFVEGERRVLVMHLVGSCRTNSCSGAQTCTENGCQSIDADLQEWTGSPPTLEGGGPADSGTPPPDASPDTGDMCGAGETNCAGACVDTSSDANHCGRCNNQCRGRDSCVDGFCM